MHIKRKTFINEKMMFVHKRNKWSNLNNKNSKRILLWIDLSVMQRERERKQKKERIRIYSTIT